MRWTFNFDEDSMSMKCILGIEDQVRLMSNAMRSMEEAVTRNAVVEYLRNQGWTLEPPRQITPEYLASQGAPAVFTPAEDIIAISRGNGDATIDLTPAQAREVATNLNRWADHYGEPKWSS